MTAPCRGLSPLKLDLKRALLGLLLIAGGCTEPRAEAPAPPAVEEEAPPPTRLAPARPLAPKITRHRGTTAPKPPPSAGQIEGCVADCWSDCVADPICVGGLDCGPDCYALMNAPQRARFDDALGCSFLCYGEASAERCIGPCFRDQACRAMSVCATRKCGGDEDLPCLKSCGARAPKPSREAFRAMLACMKPWADTSEGTRDSLPEMLIRWPGVQRPLGTSIRACQQGCVQPEPERVAIAKALSCGQRCGRRRAREQQVCSDACYDSLTLPQQAGYDRAAVCTVACELPEHRKSLCSLVCMGDPSCRRLSACVDRCKGREKISCLAGCFDRYKGGAELFRRATECRSRR